MKLSRSSVAFVFIWLALISLIELGTAQSVPTWLIIIGYPATALVFSLSLRAYVRATVKEMK